jgi:hypothetical protein
VPSQTANTTAEMLIDGRLIVLWSVVIIYVSYTYSPPWEASKFASVKGIRLSAIW